MSGYWNRDTFTCIPLRAANWAGTIRIAAMSPRKLTNMFLRALAFL